MFKNYIKIAWRHALKNKTNTFISLLSLVLGISLFFLISIWVEHEYSYDRGFADSDRVYRIESDLLLQDGTNSPVPTVGWPVGKTIVEHYPEVESLTYMRNWSPIVTIQGEKYYEDALFADENFFKVFDYEIEQGNADEALKNPNSLVITADLKRKYFGDKNALGETIMLSDTIPYKITGVLKEITNPSHLSFDMIGSFSTICSGRPEFCADQFTQGWMNVNVYNYLKLKSSTNKTAFAEKVKDVVGIYGKEAVDRYGFEHTLFMRPLTDIYLKSGQATGRGTVGDIVSVRLFIAIGLFILILACLNFINLVTASSMVRAKEIGIKKVFGGNRKSLIIQFLFESGFMCVIACFTSLIIVIIVLPFFNQFTGKSFVILDLFTLKRLSILIGVLLILIPLAGFYPARIMSSFKPIKVLKGSFSHSYTGNSLRKALVVLQFVISITFIVSTIVIHQQMNYMKSTDLGFEKDGIIMLNATRVPWNLRHNSAEVFKNNLKAKTGITDVSASAAIPGLTGWDGQFAYPEGRTKDEGLIVEYIPVDYEYIETLGLEFAEGRNFIHNSKLDFNESFIINETAVEKFGWGNSKSAIGKKLATSGKEGKVIGVLKDYHQHGLQNQIKPIVLSLVNFIRIFAIKYENISGKDAITAITSSWKDTYQGYPFEYRFFDEVIQRQYEREEKSSHFFQLATFLSIVIACLGLLGLSIYTAKKRIKEIGVRKVTGAKVMNIVTLLSRDFLKLVLIAIVISIPIAWYAMSEWLQDFAYRVELNWWVFLLAGLSAISIAFLSVCYHSIRAANMNPVDSLRTE